MEENKEFQVLDILIKCFEDFEKMTFKDELLWLDLPENQAVISLHHGFGTHIRNKFDMWNHESDICKAFKRIGILHADDISSIILTSYHRKCNGLPIDIDNQLPQYWKHWEKYNETNLLPTNMKDVEEKYLNLYKSLK